jgi:hypothetical protein
MANIAYLAISVQAQVRPGAIRHLQFDISARNLSRQQAAPQAWERP